MSTIEKAVEKLEKLEQAEQPDAATNTPAQATSPLGEQAPTQPARPARPAAPVAPAAGQREARKSASREILDIPLAQLAEKGMITPAMPRSPIAEEYRAIKRPLLRNIKGETAAVVDKPNLIMVTSALQGDGKTFTAINLAMSIAMEQDKTVLFVDADVAKASAGRLLGVPDTHPGLIDVLEGKGVSLAEVIIPTNVPSLRILPAGNLHERSTELLASHSMQLLMRELSDRYHDRVIIFDSPPLLLTTEAGVLASFMGQIAFVVSTDETPQDAVTEALQHIGEEQVIGMVLNKAHRRRSRLLGLGYGASYKAYSYDYGARHRDQSGGDGD